MNSALVRRPTGPRPPAAALAGDEARTALSAAATPGLSDSVGQVYEDYCRRVEAGESIDPDEYCARYPDLRSSLGRLLRLHLFLEDNSEYLDEEPIVWPELGQEFLGCRLLSELGRGAFARVYLATQPALGDRLAALKVSRGGGAEAKILGRIHHPNIVPVHSVQEDPVTGLTGVCMRYLGSATLEHVLDKCRSHRPTHARAILDAVADSLAPDADGAGHEPAPPLRHGTFAEGVAFLGAQLAEALQFIHQRRIVHGDLKPSNVLLTPEARPILLDFNLSNDPHTDDARLGGTLPYMSPEHLPGLGRKKAAPLPAVDGRADLFSLGVLLYELLTGRHPFGTLPLKLSLPEACRLLQARHQTRVVPPERWNAAVRPELARLIEKCLAHDALDRPSQAAELARQLRACCVPVPRPRPLPQRRWRWAVAAVLLCAGAAMMGNLGSPQDPANSPPQAQREIDKAKELHLGRKAFKEKHYSQALLHLNRVVDNCMGRRYSQEERAAVFLLRARIHQAIGPGADEHFSLAIQDYMRAHELKPDGWARAGHGYCLAQSKWVNWLEAKLRFNEAIACGCTEAAVYNNLGYCCLKTNTDIHSAKKYLDLALLRDPNLQAAYHNRAWFFQRQANAETFFLSCWIPRIRYCCWLRLAQEDMKHALALPPLNAELFRDAAYMWIRSAKFQSTDMAVAVDFFKSAVQHGYDPKLVAKDGLLADLKNHHSVKVLVDGQVPEALAQPLPPTPRVVDAAERG